MAEIDISAALSRLFVTIRCTKVNVMYVAVVFDRHIRMSGGVVIVQGLKQKMLRAFKICLEEKTNKESQLAVWL